MNRALKFVKTHTTLFAEGCGNLKDTLSSSNYTNMKMTYTEFGVEVEYKNVFFIIPLANVSMAVFVEPPVNTAVESSSKKVPGNR